MSNLSWEKIGSETVYTSAYMKVWQDSVRLPSGVTIADYDGVDLPDGVLVIATDDRDNALLFKEYKYAVDDTTLTFPAGGMDGAETPVEAAARELLEETGYKATEYEVLSKLYPYPSKIRHALYLVRAKNAQKVTGVNHGETESISEVELVPSAQLWKMLRNNEFNTPYMVAAIAQAFPENN